MQARKSLGSPREARAKWGQNFLRNESILKKIAIFAQIEKTDTVVEVGPGEGGLTKFLLEQSQNVIAIEKDKFLAEQLKNKFREQITDNRLRIIEGDILDYRLKSINYRLVGNIPYYITGAIFKKFLQTGNQPGSITFVVQKEVADRIMACDGKESILSISIKAYGTPEYGGIIKAGSFSPKPKVDSAIIAVRNINKKRFKEGNIKEEDFFKILRKGFSHKRKLVIRNLGATKEMFKTCGIPEKARAEDLKVSDWVGLTEKFSPLASL